MSFNSATVTSWFVLVLYHCISVSLQASACSLFSQFSSVNIA